MDIKKRIGKTIVTVEKLSYGKISLKIKKINGKVFIHLSEEEWEDFSDKLFQMSRKQVLVQFFAWFSIITNLILTGVVVWLTWIILG